MVEIESSSRTEECLLSLLGADVRRSAKVREIGFPMKTSSGSNESEIGVHCCSTSFQLQVRRFPKALEGLSCDEISVNGNVSRRTSDTTEFHPTELRRRSCFQSVLQNILGRTRVYLRKTNFVAPASAALCVVLDNEENGRRDEGPIALINGFFSLHRVCGATPRRFGERVPRDLKSIAYARSRWLKLAPWERPPFCTMLSGEWVIMGLDIRVRPLVADDR